MQITHVIRQFEPSVGGMETVVKSLAAEQIKKGHEVRVVTLNRVFGSDEKLPDQETIDGIEVRRIPFRGPQRYPIATSALKCIGDCDIVHVHAIDFFFDYLALSKFFHRKTMVVSTHGGFFHTPFAARLKKIFFLTVTRLSLSQYAFVAASSDPDRVMFSRLRSKGIGLLENGVDCAKFADLTRTGGVKQLIYFGRFAPHKNLYALISFLRAMRARDPDWRLLITGRPWGVTAAELRAAARKAGLEDAVDVVEMPSDEELRKSIARSSIFVSPSQYEGFGIAVIEALSAGLFVAASDIPAHRQTLQNLPGTRLIDFERPEEAADVVLQSFRKADLGDGHREEVKKALGTYSWTGVAERCEELYQRALGNGSRRILETHVSSCSDAEALSRIADSVKRRETLRVAFVNAHLALISAKHRELAHALTDFLLLNDGVGVDLASALLYRKKFDDNLNGTDFTPRLLDRLQNGTKVFLLGGTVKVVEKAAALYAHRWPQHELVGFCHGYFSERDEVAVANMVRAAKPDLILVGMGCPRQEMWLSKYVPAVCPVGLAIGALFDFQTGQIPRAPHWVRALRLEWAFRLAQEPKRLSRRYLIGNPSFVLRTGLQWLRGERA